MSSPVPTNRHVFGWAGDQLLESVSPLERQAVLDDQLRALDGAVDRAYLVADDRAIARGADPQGIR